MGQHDRLGSVDADTWASVDERSGDDCGCQSGSAHGSLKRWKCLDEYKRGLRVDWLAKRWWTIGVATYVPSQVF
jgi:hypothetical protein